MIVAIILGHDNILFFKDIGIPMKDTLAQLTTYLPCGQHTGMREVRQNNG